MSERAPLLPSKDAAPLRSAPLLPSDDATATATATTSPSSTSTKRLSPQLPVLHIRTSSDPPTSRGIAFGSNASMIDYENLPPFGHVHYSHRAPWLRAAVLGANDGLVSTTGLMLGIAAADYDFARTIMTGIAGVVAGSCSMALGEFVSVHSQKDAEESDVRREREEFLKSPLHAARELEELAQLYEARGLSARLSRMIAEELHATGDLDAIVRFHIKDELAIDTEELSNPLQAAVASALSFAFGGSLPLLAAYVFNRKGEEDRSESRQRALVVVAVTATVGLLTFGIVGAALGGAAKWKAALRVLIGGWLAMIVTYSVGKAFEAMAV